MGTTRNKTRDYYTHATFYLLHNLDVISDVRSPTNINNSEAQFTQLTNQIACAIMAASLFVIQTPKKMTSAVLLENNTKLN